jgi:hypothetical protein
MIGRVVCLFWVVSGCGPSEPAPPTAPPAPPTAPPAEPAAAPLPSPVAVAKAVASPLARETTPEIEAARATLRAVVERWAVDPNNPWAIAHAMLALGPDFDVAGRGNATDFLFAEYALEDRVGERALVAFPEKRGDIRIEPHADLLLRAFAEMGVLPDRVVKVRGRDVPVGDLWVDSLYHTWVDGGAVSNASWNDMPWTISGLALWAPPGLAWTAEGGRSMTMDGLTSALVQKVGEETAFLATALDRGEVVEKRGQAIFAYTCGGAHMLQGAGVAVGRGFGTDADRVIMARQVELYLYRLRVELPQVDAAIRQHPQYRLALITQRLKFLGHLVETTHGLLARGVATTTPEQVEALRRAEHELVQTVTAMDKGGVFAALAEIRAKDEQQYLDVVGDAAHALRALDLATGTPVLR